jgi:hypothetical protein
MAPDLDAQRMGDALAAIRAKLAKMRLESEASPLRLAETRQAADLNAAARDEQQRTQAGDSPQ